MSSIHSVTVKWAPQRNFRWLAHRKRRNHLSWLGLVPANWNSRFRVACRSTLAGPGTYCFVENLVASRYSVVHQLLEFSKITRLINVESATGCRNREIPNWSFFDYVLRLYSFVYYVRCACVLCSYDLMREYFLKFAKQTLLRGAREWCSWN